MLIRFQSTTLFQIFCKLTCYYLSLLFSFLRNINTGDIFQRVKSVPGLSMKADSEPDDNN